MEFACEFVYIPTSANQKEGQRSQPNVIKRSALLPPIGKVRPRSPPPPPPTKDTELSRPQSSPSTQSFIETLGKEDDDGKVTKTSPFYENASFLLKQGESAAGGLKAPQETTPPRKAALLPPHMRPAANSKSLPYSQPPPSSNANNQMLTYDLPKDELCSAVHPWDPNYSYSNPECASGEVNPPFAATHGHSVATQKTAPPLPPRPEFMKSIPEYLVLLPSSAAPSSPSQKSPSLNPHTTNSTGPADKGPLSGNPNVILVSLGKLLSEENEEHGCTILEPSLCSQCGSVLESNYDNMVTECYFCQSQEPPNQDSPQRPPCRLDACHHGLFLLNPEDTPMTPDALLLFCIDISGSMSMTSQVSNGEQVVYRSRLQHVQEAVLECVQRLSKQQPDVRVGLITFNNQVTIHGYEEVTSRFLCGAELIDSEYLKEAAFSLPSPPPLHRTRDCLQREVLSLCESGATALGPAALLSIAMASRQSGSKVIICTDGKANTELGNLEVEDRDSRTLTSSTIFYQDLGEYAAMQGVTVSVLTIEGTDCRLDELGRLADRTGGKVVIASPHKLHTEFEEIIENRTIATHCSITLLLPRTLRMIGERETGHKAMRWVGNISLNTEITFQFGAKPHNSEVVPAPAPGSRVSIQLQVRYRRRDARRILRVYTMDREVTDDSWVVLSSLSLGIIQLNSSQASAALAVRGRFLDAQREAETQRKLIERALEYNHRREDQQIYSEWIKTMEPIYDGIQNYTRRNSVVSDAQSLTDTGAALLYTMKHSNRKSISRKSKHRS